MNFFQKWIIDRFLKGYVRKGLDLISGPLNGKKTELTLGLLALLLFFQSMTDVESLKDLMQLVIEQISSVGDVSVESARDVTLIGFLTALFHRLLKKTDDDA